MKWTTEKPTTAGWYWHRYAREARGWCVRLEWNLGGPQPRGPSDELYLSDGRPLTCMGTSEWSDAPIEPPDSSTGHCTRCGESDITKRDGRCQNVPASQHAWWS